MGKKSTVVNKHFKLFPKVQRDSLETTREYIHEIIPFAEEGIAWGMPTFVIGGVNLIHLEGFKEHNSLFPGNGVLAKELAKDLKSYKTSKGTIQFAMEIPFPRALLKKILLHRIKQINASFPKKSGEFLEFYDNGALKSKGKFKNGLLHGNWEWYRRTGIIMRTGSFKDGVQIGTWTTYNATGKLVKETHFK